MAARELTNYQPPRGKPAVTSYGSLSRAGYRIEKLTFESEPGMSIPAVLAVPDARVAAAPAIVYADCKPGVSQIENFVKQGSVVLAIDIRGCGELAERETRPTENWFGDARNVSAALLLGKTMVGLRALDIVAAVEVLTLRRRRRRD